MELHRDMLNKTIPIPLYFQLKELILADIKSGKSPYGSMIPTEMNCYGTQCKQNNRKTGNYGIGSRRLVVPCQK